MRSRGGTLGARRVVIARILLLLPFLGLAGRAAYLAVDERGHDRGDAQIDTLLTLAAERGVIVDRNGAELALSVDAPSVYATAVALSDIDATARGLARALGGDRRAIAKRLRAMNRFAFIARWVNPKQAKRVEALGLDGVGVLYEPRRVYPNRALAGQILGFTNIDGKGVRGLEQVEDAWLRGTARRLPVERDARGRLLATGGEDHWSTAGGDIAVTIDATLQADAEAALSDAIASTGARGGVVISLDPHSGDILALAEAPSFDPNLFRKLDYRSTRSRAFLDASDPGSTLKAFLMATALERGAVVPEQEFDCEGGSFAVPGSVIHDSHPHDVLTVAEILRVSSNICAAKIAFAMGRKEHFDGLRLFGFGKVTGSSFPGESAGMLRPWKEWRPLDQATIAFGQGVTVTPVQMAAATAALANGGEWVRPRLVKARRAAGGEWQPAASSKKRRAVQPETAAAILAMMEGVVSPEGTARRAGLRDVRVAGKTGTAQKLDPKSGTYSTERFTAWFIGIVPADAPKLVIVAGVDEPRRPQHTGGAAAAPLFARVATAQLARLGIFTEPTWGTPLPPAALPEIQIVATPEDDPVAKETPGVSTAPPAPAKTRTATVPTKTPEPPASDTSSLVLIGDRMLLPNFHGLTESEVRKITADSPLDVKVTGRGRAVRQVPPAGTILASGQALVLIHFEQKASGKTGEEG